MEKMDLLTLIIITLTFSALLLSYMVQKIRDEKKQRNYLNQLLEEENKVLHRQLKGENVPFKNEYEITKTLFDRVYH